MCQDQRVNRSWINPGMVGLMAGLHHRQQKFPWTMNRNQRCDNWNGPNEQEQESLGAEEDSVHVGDGNVQCKG